MAGGRVSTCLPLVYLTITALGFVMRLQDRRSSNRGTCDTAAELVATHVRDCLPSMSQADITCMPTTQETFSLVSRRAHHKACEGYQHRSSRVRPACTP